METQRTVVHLQGVSRVFPPSTVALKQASFELFEGESIAIVGASGSGKSTLLSILGLLQTPSSGTYELDGQDVSALTAAQRTRVRRDVIGFVFQSFHLIPYLSLTENILDTLHARGVPRKDATRRASEALERVGLSHRVSHRPPTLSGGEQQRAAIARALACEPRLLLCDEPTGNLDSVNSTLILNLLHGASDRRSTLVIVTHDSLVADSCSRTLTTNDGEVREIP